MPTTNPGHGDARATSKSWNTPLVRVVLVVALALVAAELHVVQGLPAGFFDLDIYRNATRWWAAGNPLYDYSQPDRVMGSLGLSYPTAGAAMLLPFSQLSHLQAVVVYVAVSVPLFAATMWWLVRPIADRHGWPRWFVFSVAAILATGLEPVRWTFELGQINFLLWALVVVDLAVLGPRRSRFAGVGIGLATAIKLVPGIFILYLLVSRRRRQAIVAAAVALATTLIVAVVFPADSATFWGRELFDNKAVGRLSWFQNQSLNGMIARLTDTDRPSKALWLLLALPVLVWGITRARRAALAGDELTGIALAGLTGGLVSPLTWTHHAFWFIPAALAMVDTAAAPGSEVRTRVLSGLRDRRIMVLVVLVIETTLTQSMTNEWATTLGQPGGVGGFILSNWMVLLMLALVAVMPIDVRATVPSLDRSGDTHLVARADDAHPAEDDQAQDQVLAGRQPHDGGVLADAVRHPQHAADDRDHPTGRGEPRQLARAQRDHDLRPHHRAGEGRGEDPEHAGRGIRVQQHVDHDAGRDRSEERVHPRGAVQHEQPHHDDPAGDHHQVGDHGGGQALPEPVGDPGAALREQQPVHAG